MFEEKKEKEFVFRCKVSKIKFIGAIILFIILIGVIVAQHYYPNCKRCTNCENKEAEESNAILPAAPKAEEPAVITPAAVVEQVNLSSNVSVNLTKEDDGFLPITGDVYLTIDSIKTEIRGDDYARVISVRYTIKNQDVDFTPVVKAHLTIDTEDIKEVTLSELKAGTSYTKTEPKLTFGYKDITKDKVLKLDVYDKKGKLIVSSSKTFKTE